MPGNRFQHHISAGSNGRRGLVRGPFQRRKHQRSAPLTAEELARQDAIKAQRDRVAAELKLEATLIANRTQLAQLAREPETLDELLLPWQAELLRPAVH